MLLCSAFMTHCAAAVMTMQTAMVIRIGVRAAKSTAFGPTMQSTARPTRIGTYSVSATLMRHSASESTTSETCGPIYWSTRRMTAPCEAMEGVFLSLAIYFPSFLNWDA